MQINQWETYEEFQERTRAEFPEEMKALQTNKESK